LDEVLGLFGERESFVIDGGEVEIFEDAVYIVGFGGSFSGSYDFFVGGEFLVLGDLLVGIQ